MQQMPDETDRAAQATAEPTNPSETAAKAHGSHTAAAGRAFFAALGSDLAELRHRLRIALAHRRQTVRTQRSGGGRLSFARSSGRVVRRFSIWLVVLGTIGMIGLSGAMLWALRDLPLDKPIVHAAGPALLLEAANGEPLGRVGPLKVAEAARDDFPEHLVQAVLSIEDRRFYSHFGVDPLGIVRAASRNWSAGEIVEGGSTITQQFVKMRYLGNDRTLVRKAREALTSIWLELRLSKDEILTRYLNSLYMGAGAHGMAAAARLYFNKRPAELTLSEAALLAGLIRAPSLYNPLRNLDTARWRADVVINAMLENGVIDEQAARDARAKPAVLSLAPEATQAGSWFADWVAKSAPDLTGAFTNSVRVRTTLEPKLQRLAEQVINEALAEHGRRANVSQAALVALRPDGAVLAMVGGSDYRKSAFNRAIEANRHPGSAFKLFVYLAALRNGMSPHDMVDASPIEIKGWRPENYGDRQYGQMPLAEAFARSINTAAVRLAMQVGLKEVISAARDLGINARLSAVPSLALGAVEVSLLDITGAFASVRAGRMPVQPWAVSAFGDENRLRVVGPPAASGRSLAPYQEPLTELLRLVVERGTGRAAALDGFAAGKTGTSQNHRDAWFIGFNEALVVGVWVGNDDGTPMERVVGGTLPASIWKRFVSEAGGLMSQQSGPVAEAPKEGVTPASTGITRPETWGAATPESSEISRQPQCDFQACAGAYRSFRVSDCTYQPYSGGRAFCDKGAAPEATDRSLRSASDSRAPAQCNVAVCSRFYRSFNASDCSYQPFEGGPRRICDR